jgi:hypothetical protein
MVTVIIQRDEDDLFVEMNRTPDGWKDIAAFLRDGEQVDLTEDELGAAITLADAGVDYTGTDE